MNNYLMQFDFNAFNLKFDYDKYEKSKSWNGEKEYMLKFLISSPIFNQISNFLISDFKILLIKNCPIDKNLPKSPIITGYEKPKNFKIVRDFILSIYDILNIIPYAYKYENSGKLFRSVVPVKNNDNMIGSYGSNIAFNFHSDNPTYKIYGEYRKKSLNSPEFLSLYCIRGQKDVNTNVIVLNNIINLLDSKTIDILSSNLFTVNTPNSFDKYHKVKNVSVISKQNKKYYTRFDYHNLKPTNKKSLKALNNFISTISKIEILSHEFKSGDFLIFKNQEVLHSRDAFKPLYNGFDRWLIRVYGASNIAFLNNKEIKFGVKQCF